MGVEFYTDRQADKTRLIVAFRNSASALKKKSYPDIIDIGTQRFNTADAKFASS
jgi:hypothetical protein